MPMIAHCIKLNVNLITSREDYPIDQNPISLKLFMTGLSEHVEV